jgi:branched-chain amino acid transport system substrate-binding protein
MIVSQKWRDRKIYSLIAILVAGGLGWLAYVQVTSASAPPTLKIGLIAPFEGLYRSTGYEVLFAVKTALRERNEAGGVRGYQVELVAINDFNDPVEAARQARALATDPEILGVVGHLTSASTLAAIPIYEEAELAVVIPWSVEGSAFKEDGQGVVSVAATYEETLARLENARGQMGFERVATLSDVEVSAIPGEVQALQLTTDAVTAGNIIVALRDSNHILPLFGDAEAGNLQLIQVAGAAAQGFVYVSPAPGGAEVADNRAFIAAYEAMSGLVPGPRAVLAYDATNVLLDSIELAMIMKEGWLNHSPSRADVAAVITEVRRQGLSGEIVFASTGRRLEAPVWVYQISEVSYPGMLIAP